MDRRIRDRTLFGSIIYRGISHQLHTFICNRYEDPEENMKTKSFEYLTL